MVIEFLEAVARQRGSTQHEKLSGSSLWRVMWEGGEEELVVRETDDRSNTYMDKSKVSSFYLIYFSSKINIDVVKYFWRNCENKFCPNENKGLCIILRNREVF